MKQKGSTIPDLMSVFTWQHFIHLLITPNCTRSH